MVAVVGQTLIAGEEQSLQFGVVCTAVPTFDPPAHLGAPQTRGHSNHLDPLQMMFAAWVRMDVYSTCQCQMRARKLEMRLVGVCLLMPKLSNCCFSVAIQSITGVDRVE